MNLREYYNFSEDTNVTLKYTSFFDEQPDDFPCPSNMSGAFQSQSRNCIKLLNTSNVTNMSNMFYNCNNLLTIPNFDTSKVTNMSNMFQNCGQLITIPQLNTSNVTNMRYMFADCPNLLTIPQLDTSNVTDMNTMFYKFSGSDCKLKSIPPLDCSKVTNMGNYFGYSSYPRTVLTDVGGWINLKCNWNDGYGLNTCPNLTYESCINVLNGLYDFTANGETPTSSQGKLKVNSAFIEKLTEEDLQIAIRKGWVIQS